MKLINNLLLMLFSPEQLAIVILLAVLAVALIVGNVVLYFYLRNRGVRKLCTHQLQSKRDELLQQLNLLRAGEFVGAEEDEEEEEEAAEAEADEMLIVDNEEDDSDDEEEDETQTSDDRHKLGVVTQEEVDETMDAEILYIDRTPADVREKLGFASSEYDKKRYYVRYSLGFEARLRSSSDEVKERYVALMNEINLYTGLKVKGSYRQQRIYKGRKTLGLIMFRGKTLSIALALNPADYEDTKFHGIDKSDSRRFKKTPMLMKLTSQRRLDYVRYLLVQLAEDNTILLANEPETLTFDLEEKTREELYIDNKLQIIVLGEVPDSVPYEVLETEDEDETDEDGEGVLSYEERTKYNRSYTARIIQADDELKARYSEIKNHIVSYHGVFNSITWKREAFYVGKRRDCFATFAVRGKTLCLFLAVEASRFEGTKYKVEDRTQQVRNAKMPTMFRIKSDRGTRYAKELIDLVLAERGIKIDENYKPVNYRPTYRSTENLINSGYIRAKVTQVVTEEPQQKPAKAKKRTTSGKTANTSDKPTAPKTTRKKADKAPETGEVAGEVAVETQEEVAATKTE